jgi:hypothetical protein
LGMNETENLMFIERLDSEMNPGNKIMVSIPCHH